MDGQIASENKNMTDLAGFNKEMQGSTYKILRNKKKINIQCSIFEGKD
jgi:hypothetical protein